jgi:hypothetical protein
MRAGDRRSELDATLRAAYGEGLLSQGTFVERVGQLLATGPVHPERLVGDLSLRRHRPLRLAVAERLDRLTRLVRGAEAGAPAPLLALDWSGGPETLLIGRSDACDVRLEDATVSRRHARLVFRDGAWIVQDLGSKNGTLLNGRLVGRARLRPGDRIAFADQAFRVD